MWRIMFLLLRSYHLVCQLWLVLCCCRMTYTAGLLAGVALGGWGIFWFVAMREGVEVSQGSSE